VTIVTLTVLLVDDCLEDRETYRRYLLNDPQHTYRILEAETGEQALLLCRQQFPDVIVMDYLLPDMNGLELLNNLKTRLGQTNLPVIILTSRGNEQIAVQAMKSGADDYLVKKHTTAVSLRLAVENVLDKIRLSRQLLESEQCFQATFNQAALQQAYSELERTNTLLQQKNELLQTIFDHVPVMLALFDPYGQLRWVNREWETVLGWRCEDIQGRDLLAEFYPDADYRQYVLDYIAAADRRWGDFQTRTRDGRVLDTSWANVRLSDGSNIGIGKDITNRKTVELALRESKARFQRLATNVPGVIYQYVLHPDGSDKFTYLSPSCREIYELEAEELLQECRTVWAMIHPDDVEAVKTANTWSSQTLEPFDIEFRLIPPSGRLKWIHAKSHPERQENGDLVFDGLVMDISDRKQVEEELRRLSTTLEIRVQKRTQELQESEERFRNAFDNPLRGGCSPVKVTVLQSPKVWQLKHVDVEGHTLEGLSSSLERGCV
jgi:PAS domain S-box-containing protein